MPILDHFWYIFSQFVHDPPKDKEKAVTPLDILELETLVDRRKILCLEFAKKCLNNEKMKSLLNENGKKT